MKLISFKIKEESWTATGRTIDDFIVRLMQVTSDGRFAPPVLNHGTKGGQQKLTSEVFRGCALNQIDSSLSLDSMEGQLLRMNSRLVARVAHMARLGRRECAAAGIRSANTARRG